MKPLLIMPVIFFGSSEFSLGALQACLDAPVPVSMVITTPSRKKGRGLKEAPTPVWEFAKEHNLPVEAPENLKAQDVIEKIRAIHPQFFVVSSYGKIIPNAWLKIPSNLALNVHPSLLPKYRGAAPINWPILNGDTTTGLSIAEVTSQLDAGDIFFQSTMPLDSKMDATTLSEHLSKISYDAIKEVFLQIQDGTLKRTPQNHALSNYARKLTKEDGLINWKRSAAEIHRQVRGLVPWPNAYTFFSGEMIQILKAEASGDYNGKPGQIFLGKNDLQVQCGKGALRLATIRPAGKKEMSGADFARGRRLQGGEVFGAL